MWEAEKKLEKIAEILTVAKTPVLKNHIICKCSLTTLQCKQYINQLLQAGLLDAYPAIKLTDVPGPKNRHRMIYQTSLKGKEFLKLYNNLQRMLDDKTSLKPIQLLSK